MLTTYVVNRMHHITVCFLSLFLFYLAQSDLREALVVLEPPVEHRSHAFNCWPGRSDPGHCGEFSLGTYLCIPLFLA